jgi:hypothetical protein
MRVKRQHEVEVASDRKDIPFGRVQFFEGAI